MSAPNGSSGQQTCSPKAGQLEPCSFSERLLDTEYAIEGLFKWENAVNLVLIFLFLFVARWTFQLKFWLSARRRHKEYSFRHGFQRALTHDDNKALSVVFASYMLAVGLILWASMTGLDPDEHGMNILLIALWQVIGVVVLEIARSINDRVILRGVDNFSEVLVHANVAVGCAEGGTYVATGLIVMGALSGPATTLWQDLVSSAIWLVLSQLGFVVFAVIYDKAFTRSYNVCDEIKQRNVAAGVLLGLELVAVGLLLSNSTYKSDALLTFGVWFCVGGVILFVVRYLTDYFVMPGRALNDEIKVDRNIGAAVLMGGIHIGLVHVLNSFLPDSCYNAT